MTDLKEFYDPDTVELMYWIGNKTSPEDSFAGRHLTNHPHFEDKALRERTVQVYQIYARRKPDEVYRILKSFDTSYIILEDSICLAKSDGCRLPDLIDLDNWHIPDNGYSPVYGLRKSETPRFCDEIRRDGSEYTKFFKLVLQNRTFRMCPSSCLLIGFRRYIVPII
uniref:Uncharacterized protein n=1 Tax=Romanomermis culicivorax TaxID=13658 RepID=A0A915J1T4_ROMCU